MFDLILHIGVLAHYIMACNLKQASIAQGMARRRRNGKKMSLRKLQQQWCQPALRRKCPNPTWQMPSTSPASSEPQVQSELATDVVPISCYVVWKVRLLDHTGELILQLHQCCLTCATGKDRFARQADDVFAEVACSCCEIAIASRFSLSDYAVRVCEGECQPCQSADCHRRCIEIFHINSSERCHLQ